MEQAAPTAYFDGDMTVSACIVGCSVLTVHAAQFMNRGLDIIVPMFREMHELSMRQPPLPTAPDIDRRPLNNGKAGAAAASSANTDGTGSAKSNSPSPAEASPSASSKLRSVDHSHFTKDEFANRVFAETRFHHRKSAAIMHRLLGNYIEHLSNLVLGPDFVYPFLQYCFSR